MKLKQLLKETKGVFRPPIKKFYAGKIKHYTPYFLPWNFHSTIISIRKLKLRTDEGSWNELKKWLKPSEYQITKAKFSNVPMVQRNKHWIKQILGNDYYIEIGFPIWITWYGLGWKDKYECYDDKTEVLTKDGWKLFSRLDYNDLIACLNNDGYMEYYKPLRLLTYDYVGKMYDLNTTGVNITVTPNHRLYVAKGNQFGYGKDNITVKRNFEFCTPDKYFGKPKRFLKSFKWTGETIDYYEIPEYKYYKKIRRLDRKSEYIIPKQTFNIIPFLKFLGFFVAEGCANNKNGDIFISACNDGSEKATNEQKNIEYVLTELGLKIKKTHKERTAIGYKIYNKPLAIWLVSNCGKLAQNKKTPQFIKNLTPELITIYLEWLYKGDGHKTKTSNILTTVSSQLKNDVEELILKSGKTFYSSFSDNRGKKTITNNKSIISKHIAFHTNWLKSRNDLNISTKTINTSKNYYEKWIDYNGKVYCATVPYDKLFVKKNGKGVWCGNSPRYEWQPSFQIYFFKWQFCIFWNAPDGDNDLYYEMILWYLKYSNKDVNKAKETWGWINYNTKESTWNDKYLVNGK